MAGENWHLCSFWLFECVLRPSEGSSWGEKLEGLFRELVLPWEPDAHEHGLDSTHFQLEPRAALPTQGFPLLEGLETSPMWGCVAVGSFSGRVSIQENLRRKAGQHACYLHWQAKRTGCEHVWGPGGSSRGAWGFHISWCPWDRKVNVLILM